MDHSQFVKSVLGSGLVFCDNMNFFADEVIQRWLQDNAWVENPTSRCKWCQHMEEVRSGFSEERCRLNVAGGGSCYRQTLKDTFIPFLRNVLRGMYPSLDDLQRRVHREGPIWDGFRGGASLIGIVFHELGGTFMLMIAEAVQQRSTQ